MPSTEFAWFLGLFFAAGVGMLLYGLISLRASFVARGWPTTEGRIVSCDLKEYGDSESTTYTVEVEYTYSVGGVVHEGKRIAFGYGGSSGRGAHQEIADRLASAKSVLVRYDPSRPDRAVLSYGVNQTIIIVLVASVMMTTFIAGFAAVWYLSVRSDTGLLSSLVTQN